MSLVNKLFFLRKIWFFILIFITSKLGTNKNTYIISYIKVTNLFIYFKKIGDII